MRRLLRWSLVAMALVALVAAAVARARLDGWARRALTEQLATALDAEVSIDDLRLSLLGLNAEVEGVVVEHRGGGFRVEIPEARVHLGWRGVPLPPFRRVDVDTVRVVAPRIVLDEQRLPEGGGTGGDTRPLDLRIGNLVVEDGVFEYDDRTIPLHLAARNVDLDGAWGGVARALTGHLGFEFDLMTDPFAEPLAVSVDSTIRWRGSSIEAPRLRVEGRGVRVDGEAALDVGDGTALLAGGRFSADLPTFGATLDDSVPALAGDAAGTFRVEYGSGRPVMVEGDATVTGGALGDIVTETAAGHVVYERGRVTITDLTARAWGGDVGGRLRVGVRGPTTIDLDATGRGLSAERLLDWLDLSLPLSARVDTSLRLQGPVDDPGVWNGEGTATLTAAGGGATRVPAAGSGTFRLETGRLAARVPAARLASATLDVELDVPLGDPERGRVLLDGETADAADTLAATRTVLAALGVDTGGVLEQPLAGAGTVRADVELAGAVEVTLDLRDGSWAGEPFDAARLDVALAGDTATVRDLQWQRGEDRLSATAEIGLEGPEIRRADVDARHLSVGGLLARFVADLDVQGDASGQLELTTVDGRLRGGGKVAVEGVTMAGESFGRLDAAVEVAESRLVARDVRLTGAAFDAAADIEVNLEDGSGTVALREVGVRLEALESLASSEVPLAGLMRLDGVVGWTATGPSGEVRLRSDDATFLDQPLGGIAGLVVPDAAGVTVDLESASDESWRIVARITAGESSLPIDAAIDLADLRVDRIEGLPESIWARLTGSATLSGDLGDFDSLDIDGRLEHAELQVGVRTLESVGAANVRLRRGRIAMGPLRLEGPESAFTTELAYDLATGAVDAVAHGEVALALASAIEPEVRATGTASIDARVLGTLEDPDLQGSVRVVDGRARWLGFPATLDDIDLAFTLDGTRAELDHFTAVVSGGEIRATGSASLDPLPIGEFAFDFDLSNVRVRYPEGFEGVYEGRLRLSGDGDSALVDGDLLMLRGEYAEEFDLFGFGPTREYGAEDVTDLPNIRLDVDVSADGNVWVRNDTARIELVLDLAIGGDLERPEVTGRVNLLEGGTLEFRSVEYRIETGSLDLTDPGRIDPYVSIRAETIVENYEITLRVEGTLENLDYELTSNPSLSQQDVIALLTTGRTLDDASSSGEFTGDLAANYFAGALTEPFQRQLKQVLPLDRVRIDPLLVEAGQTDPTTRITVGKEVADDLYVIYSQDFGATERQLYEIEWQASRRVRLTTQRDTTGGIGADVRYTDRFWWYKSQKEAAAARAPAGRGEVAEPGEGGTIVAIEILGVDEARAASVRRGLPIEVGQPFRRYRLFAGREAIRRAFIEEGRIHVEVQGEAVPAEDEAGVVLRYRVLPGPRVEVVFAGAKKKERKLLRNRLEALWAESLFVEDLYRDAQDEVEEFYVERGHYTVDVVVRQSVTDDAERLEFDIDRGQQVRVEEVEIRGAEHVGEERIRKQLLTRPDSLFTRSVLRPDRLRDDVAAVRNLYLDLGYLAVRIAPPTVRLSTDGQRARVILTIEEGPRFTIEQLSVAGDPPVEPARVLEWAGLAAGDVYSRSALLEAESAVRAGLDGLGYPDAAVRGRVDVGDGRVGLVLSVTAGAPKRIAEVEVEGNLLTDEAVIRRELEFRPGETLSRQQLLGSQRNLYRLGIFRNVRITYEPVDPDRPLDQRVLVRVEESRPLGVSVGVGWDSEAKLRGSLSLTNDNLFGRDLTMRVEGVASSILRRTSVTGESPRLFGARLPTLGNYSWEQREEVGFTVERKSTAVRVEQKLTTNWRGYLRYNFQRVDLSDVEDELALQEEKLEDIRLGSVGVAFTRDTRDDVLLPSRGARVVIGGQLFADPFLSDAEFVKLAGTYSQVTTFRNRTSLAWALRLGLAPTYNATTEVPLSERFFAGGDSTIRGFPRDEVGPKTSDGIPTGGEASLVTNVEFRFPIWSNLKGVMFYDAGNVYRRIEDFDPTDIRHVLGTGVRLETPIGPIRIEYGHKLDREPGESSGEVFLAIGSPF